jgi:uncharacterized protein (TIGR03545 family)
MTTQPDSKPKKSKGPIRTEVVVPLLIIGVVTYLYFALLFDLNLKSALEWVGYEVVGAEVDIRSLQTNFGSASLHIQGVDVTNPEKPTHNMIEIGDIKFSLLWDGLLRARFIVNEVAVEQIAIDTPRSKPGKVKPPEPPKPDSHALEKAVEAGKQVAGAGANEISKQDPSSLFADLTVLMQGGQDAQLSELQKNLPSKQMLEAFQKDLNEKNKKWNDKIKTLPQGKEIDDLSARMSKIKTSNFKSPQEVADSVNQFNALINEANSKYQSVANIGNELTTDFNATQASFNQVNDQVKKDIQGLEGKLHLPKIDAKNLSYVLLQQYMSPYLAKLNHYRSMAEKTLPVSVVDKVEVTAGLKKDNTPKEPTKPDVSLQPRPRQHGVSYEFGKPRAYPYFWVKKIIISSDGKKAPYGELRSEITDITSNQLLTEKPTVLSFKGDFPEQKYMGTQGRVSFDNRGAESLTDFSFSIHEYPVSERSLVDSKDVKIAFAKATGNLQAAGQLLHFSDLKFRLDSKLTKTEFGIQASNPVVDDLLKKTFQGLPDVTIEALMNGNILSPTMDLRSNMGEALQKSLEKQLAAKIAELKAKLEGAVQAQIGAQRAQIESQLNAMKTQGTDAVKKLEDQLNAQKAKAQNQADSSKKSAEQQAKQQLQQQGQKAVDDLKKSFGL